MRVFGIGGFWGALLDGGVICALAGALSVVAGQSLPRSRFDCAAFPYRAYIWERDGAIYEKIGVRAWKDILPDMSKIIPGMVRKKAALARTTSAMDTLIRETCVAEIVHWALIIAVCPLLIIFCGIFPGAVFAAIYALGNIVFIIIQRYNRPRLVKILTRMKEMNKR